MRKKSPSPSIDLAALSTELRHFLSRVLHVSMNGEGVMGVLGGFPSSECGQFGSDGELH